MANNRLVMAMVRGHEGVRFAQLNPDVAQAHLFSSYAESMAL